MKKVLSVILSGILIASIILTGCSNISSEDVKTTEKEETHAFGKYSDFGVTLKSCFEGTYDTSAQRSIVEDDLDYLELDASKSSADFLKENGFISEIAAVYINKIEILFDNVTDIKEINVKISAIEQEVMNNLFDKDLDAVMYYAEAAKVSASYFSDNDTNRSARWGWKSIKKIRNVVVSTAASAVVGAGVGFVASGGNLAATIITAATCGFAGGKESYSTGKIVIVAKYNNNNEKNIYKRRK